MPGIFHLIFGNRVSLWSGSHILTRLIRLASQWDSLLLLLLTVITDWVGLFPEWYGSELRSHACAISTWPQSHLVNPILNLKFGWTYFICIFFWRTQDADRYRVAGMRSNTLLLLIKVLRSTCTDFEVYTYDKESIN